MSALGGVDLRRLRMFVRVVDEGGFSSAAKAMFSTQSTVSKSVQQLERGLGVTLLDRSGPGVLLTDAGTFVYEHARKILAEVAELFDGVDEIRAVRQGTLRIGLPRMGMNALFAKRYAAFRELHPLVELDIVSFSVCELLAKLRAGELDVAVTIAPLPGDFESRSILSSPTTVLMPESHRMAARQVVAMRDLAGSPLVLFEEGTPIEEAIFEGLERWGAKPVVAWRTSQIDLLYGLVATGVGVAFVPSAVARTRKHPEVHTASLACKDIRWDFVHAWRRGAYLSHSARAWLALPDSPAPIN
ncbi:MAG TPA: LysR family transcriptional regulator [Ramlibacter sp.]|uniref:LysR family transcriptional regulator n=1 Tax=Ramlibacter sp. TaxID=1917967 RepID=UPI002B949446|nr:LysR family transcriptional regulator [Ramlibacter sp.]HVZ44866.1 LysR family transcriptional regulator [Ramlibacter sp.]